MASSMEFPIPLDLILPISHRKEDRSEIMFTKYIKKAMFASFFKNIFKVFLDLFSFLRNSNSASDNRGIYSRVTSVDKEGKLHKTNSEDSPTDQGYI